MEADVIVVGAGISGLIAARTLLGAGLTPLILEADVRVGGRILTEEVLPGLAVELGAQWIGDTHHRMFALAAELGVETYDSTTRVRRPMTSPAQGVLRERDFHAQFADELADLRARVCAALTSWPPRFPRRRRGWHRTPPNGTS